MNVYVPTPSAPHSRGWKQKLSILVVFGSGLAIAAIATVTFDGPATVPPKAKLFPLPPRIPGPGFAGIAPTAVSDPPTTPQTRDAGKGARQPPLAQAGAVARKQLFFTQSVASVEPTAMPHKQSRQPPPTSFISPIAIPQAPAETSVELPPPQDLPSNMTVLGDGVYQVTSSMPAEDPDSIGVAGAGTSSRAELAPAGPENALTTDSHGTLPDAVAPSITEDTWDAQASAGVQDAPGDDASPSNAAERQLANPQVPIPVTTSLPGRADPVEASAPVVAPAEEAMTQPMEEISPVQGSDHSALTDPPAAATGIRGYPAPRPSSSPSQQDGADPCKISVQVEGQPTLEMPVYLVQGGEPAVRLSSLLDLVRPNLPANDFQRLRRSTAATGIVSIRELMSAGFNFRVVNGAVAIAWADG